MNDATANPQTQSHGDPASQQRLTFPDPSLSLIEFSDSLGLLLAGRTDRDTTNRRLSLKKVAYIRFDEAGWGATPFPEVWIEQDAAGIFRAIDPLTKNIFRHPSRRRYEVSFLSRDIFECAVQCLKEHNPAPMMELVVVTFGKREGFNVESGGLLAPGDYADLRSGEAGRHWVPTPPIFVG